MADDFRPKHLRSLPPDADLSAETERGLMDLRTTLDRARRRREAERDPDAPEPWDFPVPRPMALLFDALPSPFTRGDAERVGAEHGLDAAAVAEALREMRAHELVSEGAGDGEPAFVKHPETRNWF